MSRFGLDYIIVLGVERLLQWYTRPTHMAILCGSKIKWGHGAPRSKKAWYWEVKNDLVCRWKHLTFDPYLIKSHSLVQTKYVPTLNCFACRQLELGCTDSS